MIDDRRVREERELYDAFGPLRPDPREFLEGVERRIAERGGVPSELADDAEPDVPDDEDAGPNEARSAASSSWLRAAAGLLPPGFLPASLGIAAKKASWKAAPVLLAMPAIVVCMLLLTFAAALAQVGALDSSRKRSAFLEREEIRAWWWRNRYVVALTCAALILLYLVRPTDALVALMLASIGFLALVLRRLSAAGFASRSSVGVKCGTFLFFLGIYAGMFGAQSPAAPLPGLPRLASIVLLAGMVICYAVAWRGKAFSKLRERGLLAVVVVMLLHGVPVLAVVIVPALQGPMDADDLRKHVEEQRIERHIDWRPSARAAVWLREKGVEVDLAELSRWIDGVRAERNLIGEEWRLCDQLGLLTAEERTGRLATRAFETWREYELPRDKPLKRFQLSTDVNILVLTRSGEMTESEREHLTERALGVWPEADAWMPHEVVLGVVSTLDALGSTERFDERRADLHALLRRLWLGTDSIQDGAAGFLPKVPNRYRYANERSTLVAVTLMDRFGVPDGVDVRRVRLYLENAATKRFFWRRTFPDTIDAATALDITRTRLAESEGTWAGRILEQRVLLGVFLLVLFCCIATLRAPLDVEEEA